MDAELREKLLALVNDDERVREKLARDGSLYEGYHPEMEAVHNRNADQLEKVIREYGWPTRGLAGADGAEAAWLILQHAIARPDLQRKYLPVLKDLAARGEVDPQEAAMLEDRIRMFEGRPQVYGTQFDWDENGEMSPWVIEDPGQVDARRKSVGLPPLSETTAQHRENVRQSGAKPPGDFYARRKQMEAWCMKVGWRKG